MQRLELAVAYATTFLSMHADDLVSGRAHLHARAGKVALLHRRDCGEQHERVVQHDVINVLPRAAVLLKHLAIAKSRGEPFLVDARRQAATVGRLDALPQPGNHLLLLVAQQRAEAAGVLSKLLEQEGRHAARARGVAREDGQWHGKALRLTEQVDDRRCVEPAVGRLEVRLEMRRCNALLMLVALDGNGGTAHVDDAACLRAEQVDVLTHKGCNSRGRGREDERDARRRRLLVEPLEPIC
eukprot:6033369-Prymnesium_polylepis.1